MNFHGPPSFFIKMQCIVESLEDKHFVNVSLLKLLYFSSKNNAEYQEIDRNKSVQYKVMSRHYKWLLVITENLLEKTPTYFSSMHVRICVKDALPLITSAQNWHKTAMASLHSTFNVLSDYTHVFNFKMIVFYTSTSSVLLSCPMTSTVPLKSKLTVTCLSILETGDSRLDSQNFRGWKEVSSDWSKFLYCQL